MQKFRYCYLQDTLRVNLDNIKDNNTYTNFEQTGTTELETVATYIKSF